MLRYPTLYALYALHVASFAGAVRTVSIWLSSPERNEVGPLYTVTVGQEDYTFPDTEAADYRKDDAIVWESIPVSELLFAKVGELIYDDKQSRDIQFWIREGNKDTRTRGMTKCRATLAESPKFEAQGEIKLYFAPSGEISMFEGQEVDPNWLTCEETTLFAVPVALTEELETAYVYSYMLPL